MAASGGGLLALVLAAAKTLRPALAVAGRAGHHDNPRGSCKAVAHAAPEDRAVIVEGAEHESRWSGR